VKGNDAMNARHLSAALLLAAYLILTPDLIYADAGDALSLHTRILDDNGSLLGGVDEFGNLFLITNSETPLVVGESPSTYGGTVIPFLDNDAVAFVINGSPANRDITLVIAGDLYEFHKSSANPPSESHPIFIESPLTWILPMVSIDASGNLHLMGRLETLKPNTDIYYVSPDGNDNNNGTYSAPLETIPGVRNVIYNNHNTGSNRTSPNLMDAEIVVYFFAGNYYDSDGFKRWFDYRFSGNNGYTVTCKAYPSHYPRFSGGMDVDVSTGWQTYTGDIKYISLSAYNIDFQFRELYLNGNKLYRSRHPNISETGDTDYFRTEDTDYDENTHTLTFAVTEGEYTGGTSPPEGEIHIQKQFAGSIFQINDVTQGSGIDTLEVDVSFLDPEESDIEVGKFRGFEGTHLPYHFEDSLAFIDIPREWYYDSTNELLYLQHWFSYIPSQLTIPAESNLIGLDGRDLESNPTVESYALEHFTLSGFTFLYTRTREDVLTYDNTQAYGAETDGDISSAVTIYQANHVVLTECTFQNLGNNGLYIGNNVNDVEIIGNRFKEIAGSAIFVGHPGMAEWEAEENPDPTVPVPPEVAPHHVTISNNYMKDLGYQWLAGVGIHTQFTRRNTIEHNELLDMPWSGMNIGWRWSALGPEVNNQEHTHIRYNKISGVVNLLTDGGGIYTNSLHPGLIIEENVISDLVYSQWCLDDEEEVLFGTHTIYLDNHSYGGVDTESDPPAEVEVLVSGNVVESIDDTSVPQEGYESIEIMLNTLYEPDGTAHDLMNVNHANHALDGEDDIESHPEHEDPIPILVRAIDNSDDLLNYEVGDIEQVTNQTILDIINNAGLTDEWAWIR
jgi:hypothetical protein